MKEGQMTIFELINRKLFSKNIWCTMVLFFIVSCSSDGGSGSTPSDEKPVETLLHQWTFNDGTANDLIGDSNGVLKNGASIIDGKLVLDGIDDYVRTLPLKTSIRSKTLMAWVTLSNVFQKGGGVITLENHPDSSCIVESFDSIVYGERSDSQWIAGSEFFIRTPEDNGGSLETIRSIAQEIHISIVYSSDNSIRIYRNGNLYASHMIGVLKDYSANVADVLIGLRHECATVPGTPTGTPNGFDRFLAASVNEARIYNSALSDSEVLRIFNEGPR